MDKFVMKDWVIHKPYADQITRIHFLLNITHNIAEDKNGRTEVTKFQDVVYMDCVRSAVDEGIDWIAAFDEDYRAEPDPDREKWVKAIVNPTVVLQD
jgi:hypothetical protein